MDTSPKKENSKQKKSLRDSSNAFLRFLGDVGFYLWSGVLAIGAFLAWLISFLLI